MIGHKRKIPDQITSHLALSHRLSSLCRPGRIGHENELVNKRSNILTFKLFPQYFKRVVNGIVGCFNSLVGLFGNLLVAEAIKEF